MEMLNEIKLGEGSVENVGGMKLRKRKNPENPKIQMFPLVTLGDTETRTRDLPMDKWVV